MLSLQKLARLGSSNIAKFLDLNCSNGFKWNAVRFSSQAQSKKLESPEKCDVCIIGGGAMGSSSALWLKRRPEGKNLKVVVIERDHKYTTASTVLSLGGIRQQFSNGENIQLSLFGSRFIKNLQDYLGIKGNPPVDIQYRKSGYLFIATNTEGAKILEENHAVQKQYDSKVELLSKEKLKQKYPFLNVEDATLASVGVDNEGWFDPWSLLSVFKSKAISLGAQYVDGEVVAFEKARNESNNGPTSLQVKTSNGDIRSIEFSQCIIATGYESGNVSRMAGIGSGDGVLGVPIPVEPRKRYVYYINAPELTIEKSEDLPVLIEPNGAYFRSSGSPGNFFAGQSPDECDEPSCNNLDVDYSFFDTHVWPSIANRAKAMENIKVKSAWSGFYDYNTFDQNGIIGAHPVYKNLYFATGFSGHGIQQSPAVGRAISELILDGGFRTIDLTRFGFDRLVRNQPVLERNIV